MRFASIGICISYLVIFLLFLTGKGREYEKDITMQVEVPHSATCPNVLANCEDSKCDGIVNHGITWSVRASRDRDNVMNEEEILTEHARDAVDSPNRNKAGLCNGACGTMS